MPLNMARGSNARICDASSLNNSAPQRALIIAASNISVAAGVSAISSNQNHIAARYAVTRYMRHGAQYGALVAAINRIDGVAWR